MRIPSSRERGQPRFTRSRVAIVVAVVVLIVLLLSLRGIAGFWTDYLWFDEVGLTSVWRQSIEARLVPAAIFMIAFFVVLFGNLVIADRIAPRFLPTAQEDVTERYRRFIGPYAGRLRLGLSALFAIIAGVGVTGHWEKWLLFRHGGDFGVNDPQFGRDIGFYVFKLPFYRVVFDWTFASLIIILIVTAVAHYLNGGIRVQGPFQRVSPQVKVHLSVLLALVALVRAWGYYLERFALTTSTRGAVHGATATDVNAQLPALRLLIVISIAAVILFLVNIRLRGFALPVIAVGLWAFVSLAVGTVYPQLYQRFKVEPSEQAREAEYIAYNIDATRAAYDIADIDVQPFPYSANLTASDIDENSVTLQNARLWDPEFVGATWQNLQQVKAFYRFSQLDVDRYVINGKLTQTVLAAREINLDRLPSQSWVNRHLVYTHGQGVALAPANAVTDGGLPEFLVKDLPPTSSVPEITLDQKGLYYGERLDDYAVVNTALPEFDPGLNTATGSAAYAGSGGIELSGIFRRTAFALRFLDARLFLSGDLDDESRILIKRDIRARVRDLAPFLELDADPYPVIIESGRVVWVLDAYTTTESYPYAQAVVPGGLPSGSGLSQRFNYVRNSVKITVDSYDGSMRFYLVDESDPVIRAWRDAFPDLFTSPESMPAGLNEHLRYPEDLFRVQSGIFASYHVTDPAGFYNRSDQWSIAQDPDTGPLRGSVGGGGAVPLTEVTAGGQAISIESNTADRMDPYYLLTRLPGEPDEQYVIMQPLVPVSQDGGIQNLVSFLVARSDPERYGEISAYTMPATPRVFGPAQASNEILTTEAISETLTLLNQAGNGSSVELGNLQLVPVGNSILYIRPVYLKAEGQTQFPGLRFVAVFYKDGAVMKSTLCEALKSFPEFASIETCDVPVVDGTPPAPAPPGPPAPPPTPGSPPPPPVTTGDETVEELLRLADDAFAAAQTALDGGDLGTYQQQIELARTYVNDALNRSGGASSTPSTTSGASTSTSAPSATAPSATRSASTTTRSGATTTTSGATTSSQPTASSTISA